MHLKQIVAAACGAWLALGRHAVAADATELWPELSVYVTLSPDQRLYLDLSHARDTAADSREWHLSAFLDLSLKPVLRPALVTEDWQRNRYLWARLGYTRALKTTGADNTVTEDRGVVALHSKAALPAELWLEARARADLRWIAGDYSARYRFRLEASREFTVLAHTVMPYLNAEAFYDTRYDQWARMLYQAGTEITVDRHFRYELFLARQNDRQPRQQSLNALGLVAKWYY